MVITGASRGIGAALAREAASKGARVTLLARSVEPLQALAKEINGLCFPADIGVTEELETLVPRIEAAAGPIDVLINNAAIAVAGPFINQSAASIRSHIAINLAAPMELCRQVFPGMLQRGRGGVVMISSIAGEIAVRNVALYSPTKTGLSHFTAILQREFDKTPLNILLVILGAVDTPMLAEGMKASGESLRATKLKALSPELVANKTIQALLDDRRSLVLPLSIAPFYYLRQLPSRLTDLLMRA